MRTLAGALATLVVLTSGHAAHGRCGDGPGDAAAVAAARSAVETDCPCGAFASRKEYVRCAQGVVRGRMDANQLPAACRAAVIQCVRRATCGRPGAVTCCRACPREPSGFHCTIQPSSERCLERGGCVGSATSCCDACAGGACVTTTTTSTSTTTTTSPFTCGQEQYPTCGGTCPAAERCVAFLISDPPAPPVTNCLCSSESIECGDDDPEGFFGCGAGPCPPDGVCAFALFPSEFCGCVYP